MAERKHNEERLPAAPARQATERESPHASAAVAHPASLLRVASRAPLAPAHVLQLQRAVGNRATARIFGGRNSPPVQTKLAVGPAGDAFEQEADRVAREVVTELAAPTSAGVSPSVQCLAGDEEEREGRVRRKFDAAHAEIDSDGGTLPPDVERQLEHGRGGGRPMDEGLRARLEQSFGADFGGVRVHTGERAEALNASLDARAFTTGQDIFFGPGEYAPDTHAGQEVLAHELTHVVQQNPSVVAGGGAAARHASVSNVPASASRLQRLSTGSDSLTVGTKATALLELAQIALPIDVNNAMVELSQSEPGVLARYKNEYQNTYLANLPTNGKAIFQWPLTYLRGRAARKRGKATEQAAIDLAYPGQGITKSNRMFWVEQDDGTYEQRIPDVFTDDLVADVKNVKTLSFDYQLRDFYVIATFHDPITDEEREVLESDFHTIVEEPRSFELIVRSAAHPDGETEISGPLARAVHAVHKVLV